MSSLNNIQYSRISTIDVSHIKSLKVLKMMAKKAHEMLEEKFEEIDELFYGKNTQAICDRLYEAKERAEYIEAFVFAIYQQTYVVNNILSKTTLDDLSVAWIPHSKLNASSPAWNPKRRVSKRVRFDEFVIFVM